MCYHIKGQSYIETVHCILQNILSVLANRIANVSGLDSPSETSAVTFHTHERSDPTFGESCISAVTSMHNGFKYQSYGKENKFG